MVFTTEGLFEVAIERWPEWDLNPRPLNSVQTSTTLETDCTVSPFVLIKRVTMANAFLGLSGTVILYVIF